MNDIKLLHQNGGGSSRVVGFVGLLVFLMFPVVGNSAGNVLFQQKASLVKRFLGSSETAKRVAGRGHEGAKALLSEARAKWDSAQLAHASNNEKKALDLLDQALKLLSAASRESADPASQAWLYRARYADLSDSIRYFQDTYQKYLQHADADKRATANRALQEVTTLTRTASSLAEKKQFKKANRTLSQAQDILVSGLKPLLGSRSLVYTLKFDTPRDEYDYEVRRGESLEALIRMALAEGKVGGSFVQAFVENSRVHGKRARAKADSGKFEFAVSAQEEANSFLVRALRMLGVMIPL